MSTLRVDNIQLNQEGNAAISIANSYNVVISADGVEKLRVDATGVTVAGTGALKLPVGNTTQRPASNTSGLLRYNSTTNKFEGYGVKWGTIGAGAEVSDTAPSNSGLGDLWWNSNDGRMYIYYSDANSSQWVDTTSGAGSYLPLTGGAVTGNVSVSGNFLVGTTVPGSDGISLAVGDNLSFQEGGAGESIVNLFRQLSSGAATLGYGVKFSSTPNGFASSYSGATYRSAIQLTSGIIFYTAPTTTNAVGSDVTMTNQGGIDTNGVLSFNSGYGSARAAYGCRAWVNFNGQGTVAIRGSGGVTSITDNGTGKYAVNFSSALVDINGAVVAMQSASNGTNPSVGDRNNIDGFISSVNEARIFVSDSSTQAFYDPLIINVAVFR